MKRAVFIRIAVLFIVANITANAFPESSKGAILLQTGFEDVSLSGWRWAGDLCVTEAFCAGVPSGKYWVALSTNQADGDPFTMCGNSSLGGLQTVLRSPDLPLPFKPARIRVDFDLKFLTNENTVTDLGNDSFTIRLLTMAGPVNIASIDDAGPSPNSKNLEIRGDPSFQESACNSHWKYETGMLHVSYYRTFREPVRTKMATGPVAIEFVLTNQFDPNFDSAVVLDDVKIQVYR